MKFVATFEHGRKQWCVQLIEQGPCPIVLWCDSEKQAIDEAELCHRFSVPVINTWIAMRLHANKKQTPDTAGFGDRMDN